MEDDEEVEGRKIAQKMEEEKGMEEGEEQKEEGTDGEEIQIQDSVERKVSFAERFMSSTVVSQ